jgi:Transcriptional regulator
MSQTSSATTPESTPRLNLRQVAKIKTRGKVMDAARALFSDRGYEAATIRDIAREAGMSTGAVFANFQDKAELFEAVLTEDLGQMVADFETGARTQGPAQDRLVATLTAGYRRALDTLPMMQAVIARSWFQPAEDNARLRALCAPLREQIGQILREGVTNGDLKQDIDIELLTRTIWDFYITNYRFAAYDGWSMQELTPHVARQLDLVLASARTPTTAANRAG